MILHFFVVLLQQQHWALSKIWWSLLLFYFVRGAQHVIHFSLNWDRTIFGAYTEKNSSSPGTAVA